MGESASLADLRPLLQELGDLKRVRSAGRDGSIATRLFRNAWAGLLADPKSQDLHLRVAAAALVAARLGDIDQVFLKQTGLSVDAILAIERSAFDQVAGLIDEGLRAELRIAVGAPLPLIVSLPPFVQALQDQPRAGVTCPGKPRILLEPPESHAEHCLLVAVYGVLLAPHYGADASTVFVAGMAHHLHNATMADAGFTGEALLGPHLDAIVEAASGEALAQLPADLRDRVSTARAILPNADTPEGRAFHAADVIDRVLQIAQHLQAASLTMHTVLDDMQLVHDGPVKPFHDRVLAQAGLA